MRCRKAVVFSGIGKTGPNSKAEFGFYFCGNARSNFYELIKFALLVAARLRRVQRAVHHQPKPAHRVVARDLDGNQPLHLRADRLREILPHDQSVASVSEMGGFSDWLVRRAHYVHNCRSSERYWMASETWSLWMFSRPARSAMVRATFRMRS